MVQWRHKAVDVLSHCKHQPAAKCHSLIKNNVWKSTLGQVDMNHFNVTKLLNWPLAGSPVVRVRSGRLDLLLNCSVSKQSTQFAFATLDLKRKRRMLLRQQGYWEMFTMHAGQGKCKCEKKCKSSFSTLLRPPPWLDQCFVQSCLWLRLVLQVQFQVCSCCTWTLFLSYSYSIMRRLSGRRQDVEIGLRSTSSKGSQKALLEESDEEWNARLYSC